MEGEKIKNIFHANSNKKKAGMAIFTSDKIDLKSKTAFRDKKISLDNDKGLNSTGRYNNY